MLRGVIYLNITIDIVPMKASRGVSLQVVEWVSLTAHVPATTVMIDGEVSVN